MVETACMSCMTRLRFPDDASKMPSKCPCCGASLEGAAVRTDTNGAAHERPQLAPPQRRGVWLPVLIGAAAMLLLVLIVAPLALCLVGVVAGFLN